MKIPQKYSIANLPTPIQKVDFRGRSFLVKRDDFTGSELTGNKVRKLEYLLYHAVKNKNDYIFTCGGDQSNHCRATVIAANKFGLKTKLFLWGKENKNPDGNLFLNQMAGAEFKFLSKKDYQNVNNIMQVEAEELERNGKKTLVIPTGGSTPIGVWGYINCVEEIKKQLKPNKIGGILSAAGSGGTSAGLLLGSALHNFDIKVYAVNVIGSSDEMREIIVNLCEETLLKYKLPIKINYSNLIMLDGYSNEGYKNIAHDKVDLIKLFFHETGILLDPAYTGKAFYAFNKLFLNKNSKVLFLHTGGMFGVFNKRKDFLK
ncbi:MAG: pyridoxal-phosphate dependent enzyme [Bacteroidetes bacterium]|nr:pyridoxal-phosphate dependent enzyme [Bacteroidota bacterium]